MNVRAFALRIAPAALIAAGATLLAFVAHSALQPPVAPYELKLFRKTADAFPELAGQSIETKTLERLEVSAPDMSGKPVASAILAHDDAGRKTPLEWRNAVTEPVFFADVKAGEIIKLATAIKEHVEDDAVVFAWWDISRALRKIARRPAPLDDPQARGLLLPASWTHDAEVVAERGKTVWGAGVPAEQADSFSRFIEALLAGDEAQGAAALRALAQDKPAYLALHLSDIWKLAQAQPSAVSIAYRDFPAGGHSHGVMKAARDFMEREKIAGGYMVEPLGDVIRLHYLTDAASPNRLIARLLPFSTSNPLKLDHFQLVFQHKGYWVYKLNPAKS